MFGVVPVTVKNALHVPETPVLHCSWVSQRVRLGANVLMKSCVMLVATNALTCAVSASAGPGLSSRLAGPGGVTPRLAVIGLDPVGITFTHRPAPVPFTPQPTVTGAVPAFTMLKAP